MFVGCYGFSQSLSLQVDPRMKKDNEKKRGNAKQGKKRRLKGKQAKPTKQFNTNKSAPKR